MDPLDWLTRGAVARELNCHVSTVRRLEANGVLKPRIGDGGVRYFSYWAVKDIKESRTRRKLGHAAETRLAAFQLFERGVAWQDVALRLHTDPLRVHQRLLEKAPQHLREKVDRASRTEFRHRRYSDGLMVSVRLAPYEDHAPMTAVWMLVSLCGHLALEQLAAGQPIRGGLDIGVGVTVSADFDREAQDHLLGPVVVGAYELESDFAKWPRIVVGDEVRTYLEKATTAPTEHVGDGGQQLARKLLNTLFTNEDGSTMIDFLGKSFRDVCGPASAENVLAANRFVLAARDRWRAVDDERGPKLADRYATLARYFERRLHLWR
jgi:DNA-binding transcriptional MerR regulator